MPDKTKLSIEELEREVEKIGEYISQAKVEICAIAAPEEKTGSDKNIIDATEELNEVVRHTEEATNAIMDKADAIMALAASVTDPEISAKLSEHAVGILEACSFQDITGQRIRKVLKTLQQIEFRVSNLIKLFGGHMPEYLQIGEIEAGPQRADEELMNGPQMQGEGISQADIDKLFG